MWKFLEDGIRLGQFFACLFVWIIWPKQPKLLKNCTLLKLQFLIFGRHSLKKDKPYEIKYLPSIPSKETKGLEGIHDCKQSQGTF